MQTLVLLKWTIGLVLERSTKMMAFIIIAHWSWQAAKNGCWSKIELWKKQCVQVSFSDKHNYHLPAYKYFCKSGQEVAHSENHPPRLLTATSPKTKKSLAGFHAACAACATKRNSAERESFCAVAKKRKS